MRIDLTSNAALVRRVPADGHTRPPVAPTGADSPTVTPDRPRTDSGHTATRSPSEASPSNAGASQRASGPASPDALANDLAREPRFATLIGLMERLTGREVTLVPPATIMLGARKSPPAGQAPRSGSAPDVHIRSVRPNDGGGSYSVRATYRTADRGGGIVTIDVDRRVIEQHVQPGSASAPPLRLVVDERAAGAAPEKPLVVHHGNRDTVLVSTEAQHVDLNV